MAISKSVSRTIKLYIDNQEIDGSVKSIKSRIRELTAEMNKLTVGTEEYEAKAKKIRELNGILASHRQNIRGVAHEMDGLSGRFGKLADGFNRYMGLVGGAIASLTGLTMTVRKTVDEYAKMQEAEAQVQKYTGMTADEVERLNEDFKKMDTRTSREQLNALAGDAGRLGITSAEAIKEFVDGADKIRVALGDDLGENAVRDIGKLAQMFGEDKKKGLRGAMLATGSAINELAQNSSASADAIVQFTARLSGVAQQAGLTQAQIMGIGSVMDQNMQEIPTSATVISQLITKMMQDTGRFAALAGQDVQEFSDLLRNDANKALVTFLQAMKARGGFADMAKMFDEMKMDGSRAVGVLSALAGHLDQLAEAQELATKSYEEGTSVIKEFNVQNNTVQAQLDKAKKKFQDLSIELGEKLMPIARYGITTGSAMVKILSRLIDFVGKYRFTLVAITAALIAMNAKQLYSITLTKMQVLWNEKLIVSFKALATAIKANPWGFAISAVTTLIALFADAASAQKENAESMDAVARAHKKASEEFDQEAAKIQTLTSMVNNSNLSYEVRKQKLDELKAIVPEYHADLTKEGQLINNNTEALRRYLVNLEKSINLKAAQEDLEEAYRKKRKLAKQKDALEEQKEKDKLSLAAAGFSATQTANKLGTSGMRTISKGTDIATQQAQDRLAATQKQLSAVDKEIQSTEKDIADLNNEINKTSSQFAGVSGAPAPEPTPPPAGGGGKGGRGGGKRTPPPKKEKTEEQLERERQKQIQEQVNADLNDIDVKYYKLRNETMQKYLNGDYEDREAYQQALRDLEEKELNERLGVLNLEPEKREEIMSQILQLQIEQMEEMKELQEMAAEEEERRDEEAEEQFRQHMESMRDIAKKGMEDVGTAIGRGLAASVTGEKDGIKDALKSVLKTILTTMIDYLEMQLVIDDAMILADSIAKYGPIIGPIRAAASIALAHAPYIIAKGVVQGFEEGGFTGPGRNDETKGIVHANEFVANRYATGNRALAPVLNLIDQAQRSGSVQNLTAEDVAAVLPTTQTPKLPHSHTPKQTDDIQPAMLATLATLNSATTRLVKRLERPITAETYVTGKRGVDEAQSLADKMRSNVSRH